MGGLAGDGWIGRVKRVSGVILEAGLEVLRGFEAGLGLFDRTSNSVYYMRLTGFVSCTVIVRSSCA